MSTIIETTALAVPVAAYADEISVAIHSRTKHPDLWPLAQQLGSISALARAVNVHQSSMTEWVNLRSRPRRMDPDKAAMIESFVGKTLDELWPPALQRAIDAGSARIDATRIVAVRERDLAEAAALTSWRNDPAMLLPRDEDRSDVLEVLETLTPRRQLAVRHYFGINCRKLTFRETAKRMRITTERVRQLVKNGLNDMRRRLKHKGSYDQVLSKFTCSFEDE